MFSDAKLYACENVVWIRAQKSVQIMLLSFSWAGLPANLYHYHPALSSPYCLIFASQKAVAHLEFECCIYSALTVMQILNEIPRWN